MLSLIVAMDKNRLIGNKNKLPWYLPEDLKRFKRITMGKPIIMGSNTYKSIGNILPNRINLILSRSSSIKIKGINITLTSEEVKTFLYNNPNTESILIGGSEVYKSFFPLVTKMYITELHKSFNGDSYFIKYNKSKWDVVKKRTYYSSKLDMLYTFKVLLKV